MYPVLCLYSNGAACKLLCTHKYHHYNSIWVYGNSAPANCMLDTTPCTTAYEGGHTFKRKKSCNINFWGLFSRVIGFLTVCGFLLHISECNQSRCGAVSMLGYIWGDFFFAVEWVATAHFVHVSWKSVCTFTVFQCYHNIRNDTLSGDLGA